MSIQITQIIKRCGLWLCLLAFALPVYAGEPQVVGHISFVKGSNAAQLPGAAPRILGKDTEIFQGDNIQTTERSFVIIEFADGAKVTVRPNSNFTVDHYDSQSTNKTAQLVLHGGGVDTTSGNIAKDNPANFQIKTPTVTIKPDSKNTELAINVCDHACAEKAKIAAANKERTEETAVAHVVDIKGSVVAKKRADKTATDRPLSVGSAVYNSDQIHSERDSYALLVFPDGQKITVLADSDLDIKQYNYQIKNKKDQVLLRLTTGGLRALTGSIGKKDHSAYTLDTPVATIGIRGSGSDTETDGTFLTQTTWQDTTFVRTQDNTEYDVPVGQTLSMPNPNATPVIFTTPPDAPQPPAPRPDTDKSDPEKVNEESPPSEGDTQVKAKSGDATVVSNDGEKSTEVKEGETSSTNAEGEITTSPNSSNDEIPDIDPFENSPLENGGTGNDNSPKSPDDC